MATDGGRREGGIRYYWNKGDIIRHKQTGHPYLVVHMYSGICTIVVDLEDGSPLRPTLTLLMAEYPNYAPDKDMKDEQLNDTIEWQYDPYPTTL